jgi:toxin CptA
VQFPITIGLRRSRFPAVVLLALALLASLVALFFPRSLPLRVALLLAIWGIALWAWRRLALPLAALRLEADGGIQVAGERQDFLPATILPGATVHPWLTVLRLELADGRRCALLVTTGTTSPDEFRRLRVFLRWRACFRRPDHPSEPCS